MARILVIDDDTAVCRVVRELLADDGHEAEEARDGAEGLRRCAADPPDLVITDLVMPNKEGIETIIELRRRFPGVRIIAMSGAGGQSPTTYLAAASALGADAILRKPFRASDLRERVWAVLSEPRRDT
jgi:DNA-binding response OmpR family regulator